MLSEKCLFPKNNLYPGEYLISRVADLDPVIIWRSYSITFIKEIGPIRIRIVQKKIWTKHRHYFLFTLLHSFGILKTLTLIKFHKSFTETGTNISMQKPQDQKVSYVKSQLIRFLGIFDICSNIRTTSLFMSKLRERKLQNEASPIPKSLPKLFQKGRLQAGGKML